MSNNTTSNSGGPGTASLLGVAFVILKLCGVIDWPWIWVLAPFWIGLAVLGIILVVVGVIFAVFWLLDKV